MKISSLFATALLYSCLLPGITLQAEETVFRHELNDYRKVCDAMLSASPEVEGIQNLWGREILHIAGTPTGGKRRMALIRFDDIFGGNQNQVPRTAKITSARLGLYKIGEEKDSGQYAAAKPQQLFITLHRMLKPFQPGEPDSDSNSYSCHSYRAYGTGDDEYWGEKNQIESGPVQGVDYHIPPLGRIPLEVGLINNWYWIDLTNEVKGWAKGEHNYGFFLLAHGWWIGATFASSQHRDQDLRPVLVVEWER